MPVLPLLSQVGQVMLLSSPFLTLLLLLVASGLMPPSRIVFGYISGCDPLTCTAAFAGTYCLDRLVTYEPVPGRQSAFSTGALANGFLGGDRRRPRLEFPPLLGARFTQLGTLRNLDVSKQSFGA